MHSAWINIYFKLKSGVLFWKRDFDFKSSWSAYWPSLRPEKKNVLYLRVNLFSTKVLIGDTIFYVSYWRRDRHFTWSSEPREGLAACSTKVVPSFLSYFKTLGIGQAPGIEPATSRSAVTRSTDWDNTAAEPVKTCPSSETAAFFSMLVDIMTNNTQYTTNCTNLHPTPTSDPLAKLKLAFCTSS